ncbi:hypothetical protein [Thermaerobacter subterraneus]|uniref:Uncharacterized protein n=1 Tax=Thermaerobacter subterraneus DSM 13965 TaxID=867903 RepID=K6QD17_9FIRM|nr:hypothetical protein [Thermaerobacter subterraneus]EKP94486.1 hypothetical protein ThesuDRAFT_02223 [Thermaerobacter subterraneus DSM 13965]
MKPKVIGYLVVQQPPPPRPSLEEILKSDSISFAKPIRIIPLLLSDDNQPVVDAGEVVLGVIPACACLGEKKEE